MKHPLFAVLIASSFAGASAMASSEFEERTLELHNQSSESGDLANQLILTGFSGFAMFDGDFSGVVRATMYQDVSNEGWEILQDAMMAEEHAQIEDLNFRARLLEVQCEAKRENAYIVANTRADAEEAFLERMLNRYTTMFDRLAAEDQSHVRKHNKEMYGREYPRISNDFRNIQLSLATEFPDEYLTNFAQQCESVLTNRGRPFRRAVYPPNAGCQRISTHSGDTFHSCTMKPIFTQEPAEGDSTASNGEGEENPIAESE